MSNVRLFKHCGGPGETPHVYEFRGTIQEAEEILVTTAIIANGGKIRNAAKELGVSWNTLYRYISRFDIDLKAIRGATRG